jgi:hypothetical protein
MAAVILGEEPNSDKKRIARAKPSRKVKVSWACTGD